ncbi:Zinc finger C2H2-type protein [Neofusicoccum parvum]|uniref:Zinc finger C2H2-type protein n=1 Tax=Neofusicoccum parvum TaxID=310453 RepID=A0ACB5S863_9PEZI|nr:Zinc finger C2H2-type protein [Neofusicoccum parvum]
MKLLSPLVGALLLAAPPAADAYQPVSDDTLRTLPAAPQDFDIHNGALLAPILIPRVPGTPGIVKVRQHFIDFFANSLPNWHLELHNSTSTTPTSNGKEIEFVNLIATRDPPWTKPGDVGRLALVAHYDSKLTPHGFIGATDSAAPCAMLMHTARSIDDALTKKWQKMEADGLGEGGLEEERGVQIILLDGEEAFQSWTDTDSLYGARALAETWEATYHPGMATFQTAISSIQLFLLLDLLGSSSPRVPSYFQTTHWAYQAMAKLEQRLRDLQLFKSSPNHPSKKKESRAFDEPVFLQDANRDVNAHMGGMVSDDHLPFMARGVEILHMIPTPFPRVWHELDDDGEHLDLDTVEDWARLVTAFACEWMELEGFMSTAPASKRAEKSELGGFDCVALSTGSVSLAGFEVPIKWDLTREFVLYPNGKGGTVKLPSTQHVKRPSPEMVQKLRQGKPEFFLTDCKITPASEISHEWGYEGSILIYDPKDPAVSSVEYVYLTDHLPEQAETRRDVLTDPKSNLFFVTLKGDSLPTYHFWQDVRKDGNPGEAEVFDWATYMDACASRRASEQLDSDTIRISGELHHANDDFEDNEEDKIDEAINAKLRRVTRSTRLRDDLSDDDSIKLGRPSRKHRYAPTPKPPPGRDSYDDFFLDSNNNELEGEALHRGLKDLFGFGRYYECPTDRFEYADPEVERLAREFEENLRVEGLQSTLRDFGFWQGNRSKKNQHFGGRSPPSEPPKRDWPKNKVLETVAYKLAVASKHTKGLLPLTGDEPWTRDDGIGFWTSLDPKVKPRVPNRLQKQDPTRYKRPAGITKERNKKENMFAGGFANFRSRFQRAPREPSYIRPWEQTSWKPNLQVDSEIELHQHLRRLRRRPKKSNLRQTTTRSTLSSSRPTQYPSSGRSSEWRTVTSSGISSRLAPPGAWSFRTRSTRSYPDSSPNHSPMSDVRYTTPAPFLPRTSSSSFPTRTDSRETYAPSTLSFADSWWQQNSQLYGPLRQRSSFARFATASSGTLPSSSRHASADARATGLVDEDLRFRDFDGKHTSGLHRGRRAASKGRVSFDLPEDDGGRRVPFREVRLRDGRLREVRSGLHKTRDGGERVQRDTYQTCTEDLTGTSDWLKRHHYRMHGRYLRNSNSSSSEYVPWSTVPCHVCHKLLATPREYALCYKHHFKGRLGNALENHPEVQRELRRMNWRVTCPTCHRDLRDLTRLEWPKHFASHGPTLASIAERKSREKTDFWKQWFDNARGYGPVAGNVRNTVDQYICSICKNPLVEMTTAQKRQHYNAHVQKGAAVPGKFATTAEAAADVNATMSESESDDPAKGH